MLCSYNATTRVCLFECSVVSKDYREVQMQRKFVDRFLGLTDCKSALSVSASNVCNPFVCQSVHCVHCTVLWCFLHEIKRIYILDVVQQV